MLCPCICKGGGMGVGLLSFSGCSLLGLILSPAVWCQCAESSCGVLGSYPCCGVVVLSLAVKCQVVTVPAMLGCPPPSCGSCALSQLVHSCSCGYLLVTYSLVLVTGSAWPCNLPVCLQHCLVEFLQMQGDGLVGFPVGSWSG